MIEFVDENVVDNFKKRYSTLHPLIFQRSLERAETVLELFEILENVPSKMPIVWDEATRSWKRDLDFLCKNLLKSMKKK